MKQYNSRVGVIEGLINRAIEPTPFASADLHSQLLYSLEEEEYALVQLDPTNDPDLVGLIVNGQLRITYRKTTVYVEGSEVARAQLKKATEAALQKIQIIRNFNRGIHIFDDETRKRRTRPFFGDVGEESIIEETEELISFKDEYILDDLSDKITEVQFLNESTNEPNND